MFYSDFGSEIDIFFSRANWSPSFALLPKRCVISGQRIWLKRGMLGVAKYTGPGDPVYEYRWVDKHQWLIQRLKGKL